MVRKSKNKKKSKGRVRTRRSDTKEAKRHAESGGSRFDRPLKGEYSDFKTKEGKNRIRIMPITESAPEWQRHWAIQIWMHYGIGPDDSSYLCPRKSMNKNEPCPICDEMQRAQRSGDSDYASDLRPNPRWLLWVIDRNDEEAGPKIFLMPDILESNICGVSEDDTTGELLDIDNEDEGYDIIFHREGSGKRSRYKTIKVVRKSSPLSKDEEEMDEWLDFIDENPLDKCLNFFDEEYLEQMFSGSAPSKRDDDDDDDDDDDEDPPRTRSSARRGKRKSKREEIDDEDEDLDEDDDEDEEPRKKSRRSGGTKKRSGSGSRKTSRSKVRDKVRERLDDDDDEDDDEDDE